MNFENNLLLQVHLHGHVLSIVGGLPGQYYSTPEGNRKGGGRSLDDYVQVEVAIYEDRKGSDLLFPSSLDRSLAEFDHLFSSAAEGGWVPVAEAKRLLAAFVLLDLNVQV